jgi:transcriptional regulator with XRE-family HTH domain
MSSAHEARLVQRKELLNSTLGTSRDVFWYGQGVLVFREALMVNEPLRQALLRARLRENDVAARLGVDPKTVRRWLNGRLPYPHNRAALAELVGADEADLWPSAGGPLALRSRPEELGTVYPHRWAVPRDIWVQLFGSAEREIAILAYSALFLAEDAGILRILADKGRSGVAVRVALGDPDGPNIAGRGEEEGIGDAVAAKVRNALLLYRAALGGVERVEIRLHRTVLYNSIYRADARSLVNQHAYGVPAAQAPVFSVSDTGDSEMAGLYMESFERVWAGSAQLM